MSCSSSKLSKTLQSEKLDLTVISSLVEATLYSLDDALSPAANWVLELQDMKKSLEEAMGVNITTSDIQTLQNSVGNHFVSTLKGNISSCFCSQDIVSAFSIINETLISMFPNLNTLASIRLTIPIGTASVERSFSQMKMIKTRLRSHLGEKSLSHLMKIAIESPEKLSDSDLENIVDIWYRKSRRIIV